MRLQRVLVLRIAIAKIRQTPRDMTALRSRRNARIASCTAGAICDAAARWRFHASGESQSSALKPVPANFSPRGLPSWVRK